MADSTIQMLEGLGQSVVEEVPLGFISGVGLGGEALAATASLAAEPAPATGVPGLLAKLKWPIIIGGLVVAGYMGLRYYQHKHPRGGGAVSGLGSYYRPRRPSRSRRRRGGSRRRRRGADGRFRRAA